ncbi:WG repeat-containing protein [uncultured Treponema sp.]|uniref:WG repeat-containing protein n=1 Tax=uncultured Treponema sp. TaxID=162155 RepID=UPI002587A78A|nr:WG repeat-containing protein [uncultured Treponema sp.]
MKKIFIACLSLLFIACTKSINKPLNTYTPVRFINNEGKYGLFNPDTKEVIVYPRYTYIENFSNGYGLGVLGEEGGTCEVIDTFGNILFSYKTEALSYTHCYNGFFMVVNYDVGNNVIYDQNKEYHGLYNYKGELVFKTNFIYSMNNECIVTHKKSNYIFLFFDNNGIKRKKIQLPDTFSYKSISNEIVKYEVMYDPFSNGFARFYIWNNDKKLFGMIKNDKTVVIPPVYKSLGKAFVEGVLIAETENSLYGLLNKEGDWVIQPKYKQLFNYSGKVLAAKIKNWKLIDLKENIIKSFPDNFTVISDFVENIAIFSMTINGSTKYGLMNTQGDFVLNAISEKILPNPDNGYWQVLVNNKWKMFKENIGLINTEDYLDFSKVN